MHTKGTYVFFTGFGDTFNRLKARSTWTSNNSSIPQHVTEKPFDKQQNVMQSDKSKLPTTFVNLTAYFALSAQIQYFSLQIKIKQFFHTQFVYIRDMKQRYRQRVVTHSVNNNVAVGVLVSRTTMAFDLTSSRLTRQEWPRCV